MKFEITKGERETNQSLVRRFTKRLRNSGIVRSAKSALYRKRGRSAQLVKRAALRRLDKQRQRELLKKMGKA